MAVGLLAAFGLRGAEEPKPAATNGPVRVVAAGWKASWSPDGQQLVYCQPNDQNLELYDFNTRTNRDLKLRGKDPVWSPDGKWIAYVKSPEYNLYQQEETWLIAPEGGRPKLAYPAGWPAWSADSRKIFVFSRQERKLLACDLAKPDDPPAVLSENPLAMYPEVSPDGKLIAYPMANKTQVVDSKTGEKLFTIPMEGERGGLAGWSPDSKWLTVGGYDNSPLGVWLVDLAGKKVYQLTSGPFTMPAWSPKGDKLAMDLRKGRLKEIWVLQRSWIEARIKGEVPVFPAPEE